MAQTLDEQIITIERSLGERMIGHALVILRGWLNELGEGNNFEKAFLDIQQDYSDIFDRWVSADEHWVLASPGFVWIDGERYLAYNARTRSHETSRTGMESKAPKYCPTGGCISGSSRKTRRKSRSISSGTCIR